MKFSPIISMWLCILIVAFSPIAGKISIRFVSPVLLVLFGAMLAFLFFVPWLIKNKKFGELFNKKYIGKFFLIGTLGTAFPFFILLYALKFTTPANVAILNQSEMVYSIIIAALFLGEKPTKLSAAGTVLIIAGVIVIMAGGPAGIHWKGDLMVLGCTWMFQVGSTIAKKLPKHMDHMLIAAARNLYSIPLLLLMTLSMWYCEGLYVKPYGDFYAVLLYTGILKYGLAMIFWYLAIRKLSLSKVTAFYLSYPAASFLISVAVGLEPFMWYKVFGLILTLFGAYFINKVLIQESFQKK